MAPTLPSMRGILIVYSVGGRSSALMPSLCACIGTVVAGGRDRTVRIVIPPPQLTHSHHSFHTAAWMVTTHP